MYLLLIGDPHFRVDNIPESQKFIDQVKISITKLLEESRLDYVIILGDVLHTHEKIHTLALNMAIKFFDICRSLVKTYVLVGNHDATSNTIFLESTHWMNVIKGWNNIEVVEKPEWIEKKILLCPYVPDGRFLEALSNEPEWKSAKLICGHQLLNGAKMGAIKAEGVEEWCDEYPMLISGHIHDKQEVKKNLYYTGSSMQHAFGETADKTIILYNLETKEREEIDLELPKKKIIYINANDLESVEKSLKDEYQYKLVIRGTAAECKAVKTNSVLKRLKDLENVKRVQIKEEIETESESENEESKDESEVEEKKSGVNFLEILKVIVDERDNKYVKSLLNSCLELGEDISSNPEF